MSIMHKPLEPTYTESPKFIDQIEDESLLTQQKQRKQALKERIAKYMKLNSKRT